MSRSKSDRSPLLGATFLVTGCCIGAGMLGLPTLSGMMGFFPAVTMLGAAWLFMCITGLLVLEINLWFDDEVSFISIAGRTAGPVAQLVSWVCFLFLFYALMVAYSMGAGALLSELYGEATGLEGSAPFFSIGFSLLAYPFLVRGAHAIDRLNQLFMVGLIGSYLVLICLGLPHVDPAHLSHASWKAALVPLPIMVISFGFHNMIPSLVTYCNHDRSALIRTLVLGSALPLLFYLIWEGIILGVIPPEQHQAAYAGGEDFVGRMLRRVTGTPWVGLMMDLFSLFAIVTSFLAIALSLLDFLADGFQVKKTLKGRVLLGFVVLAPPLFLAIVYPHLFLTALGYAGAFGAVVLFGILPVCMAWKGRERMGKGHPPIVPGGRLGLLVILLASAGIITVHCIKNML